MNIETFIERNYPMAADNAKRTSRSLYYALMNLSGDLLSEALPTLVDRYEASLADLKLSHDTELNRIFEIGFDSPRERRQIARA